MAISSRGPRATLTREQGRANPNDKMLRPSARVMSDRVEAIGKRVTDCDYDYVYDKRGISSTGVLREQVRASQDPGQGHLLCRKHAAKHAAKHAQSTLQSSAGVCQQRSAFADRRASAYLRFVQGRI